MRLGLGVPVGLFPLPTRAKVSWSALHARAHQGPAPRGAITHTRMSLASRRYSPESPLAVLVESLRDLLRPL